MDLEEMVRQAIRAVAFKKSVTERERLFRLLPDLLAQLEHLRFEAEMLERFGALD